MSIPASAVSIRTGLWALPVLFSLLLSGCINILPVPRTGEVEEAKALARTFRRLLSDAREQLFQEHNIAKDLKTTLEESPQIEPAVFRLKFNSYIDRLIVVRNRRRDIMSTVRQGLWNSPYVFLVQQDALKMLEHEVTRAQTWIELAQTIRLRSDLGRQKDYPEFSMLSHELGTFLAETDEDPLGNQLRSLQEEYRFGEAEAGSRTPVLSVY